jgi:hypothetical protein
VDVTYALHCQNDDSNDANGSGATQNNNYNDEGSRDVAIDGVRNSNISSSCTVERDGERRRAHLIASQHTDGIDRVKSQSNGCSTSARAVSGFGAQPRQVLVVVGLDSLFNGTFASRKCKNIPAR